MTKHMVWAARMAWIVGMIYLDAARYSYPKHGGKV